MSKSAIDAEVNNSIFRKDFAAIIALRRDLAQISPARLYNDGSDYLAGQCLVRVVSSGQFRRWSAASGLSYDTPCVLFEDVLTSNFDAAVTGGALARAIMETAGVYKSKLIDYDSNFKTAVGGREITDASAITVVKF